MIIIIIHREPRRTARRTPSGPEIVWRSAAPQASMADGAAGVEREFCITVCLGTLEVVKGDLKIPPLSQWLFIIPLANNTVGEIYNMPSGPLISERQNWRSKWRNFACTFVWPSPRVIPKERCKSTRLQALAGLAKFGKYLICSGFKKFVPKDRV